VSGNDIENISSVLSVMLIEIDSVIERSDCSLSINDICLVIRADAFAEYRARTAINNTEIIIILIQSALLLCTVMHS
jgi:hypothetical protein